MRRLLALAPLLSLAGGGAAVAQLRPRTAHELLDGIAGADPFLLALAGCCYGAALLCAAASWRALLRGCGAQLGLGEATACYSVGSLANAFLPARAGDVVRVGLFARRLPPGPRLLTVAGACGTVGALRWALLVPLAIAGAGSLLPTAALPGAAVALVPPLAAVALARRGSPRARALLAPLTCSTGRARTEAGATVLGLVASRILAASAVATACGIRHPLAAALLVVPALEVAGVVPLGAAGAGLSGGAAALAFHLHGAAPVAAFTAGLALHAVESATSVAVGAASALHSRGRDGRRPGEKPGRRRLSARAEGTSNLAAGAGAVGRQPVTVR